jgi:hypothetical protein
VRNIPLLGEVSKNIVVIVKKSLRKTVKEIKFVKKLFANDYFVLFFFFFHFRKEDINLSNL